MEAAVSADADAFAAVPAAGVAAPSPMPAVTYLNVITALTSAYIANGDAAGADHGAIWRDSPGDVQRLHALAPRYMPFCSRDLNSLRHPRLSAAVWRRQLDLTPPSTEAIGHDRDSENGRDISHAASAGAATAHERTLEAAWRAAIDARVAELFERGHSGAALQVLRIIERAEVANAKLLAPLIAGGRAARRKAALSAAAGVSLLGPTSVAAMAAQKEAASQRPSTPVVLPWLAHLAPPATADAPTFRRAVAEAIVSPIVQTSEAESAYRLRVLRDAACPTCVDLEGSEAACDTADTQRARISAAIDECGRWVRLAAASNAAWTRVETSASTDEAAADGSGEATNSTNGRQARCAPSRSDVFGAWQQDPAIRGILRRLFTRLASVPPPPKTSSSNHQLSGSRDTESVASPTADASPSQSLFASAVGAGRGVESSAHEGACDERGISLASYVVFHLRLGAALYEATAGSMLLPAILADFILDAQRSATEPGVTSTAAASQVASSVAAAGAEAPPSSSSPAGLTSLQPPPHVAALDLWQWLLLSPLPTSSAASSKRPMASVDAAGSTTRSDMSGGAFRDRAMLAQHRNDDAQDGGLRGLFAVAPPGSRLELLLKRHVPSLSQPERDLWQRLVRILPLPTAEADADTGSPILDQDESSAAPNGTVESAAQRGHQDRLPDEAMSAVLEVLLYGSLGGATAAEGGSQDGPLVSADQVTSMLRASDVSVADVPLSWLCELWLLPHYHVVDWMALRVSFDAFVVSMLELADNWSSTPDPREVAAFLSYVESVACPAPISALPLPRRAVGENPPPSGSTAASASPLGKLAALAKRSKLPAQYQRGPKVVGARQRAQAARDAHDRGFSAVEDGAPLTSALGSCEASLRDLGTLAHSLALTASADATTYLADRAGVQSATVVGTDGTSTTVLQMMTGRRSGGGGSRRSGSGGSPKGGSGAATVSGSRNGSPPSSEASPTLPPQHAQRRHAQQRDLKMAPGFRYRGTARAAAPSTSVNGSSSSATAGVDGGDARAPADRPTKERTTATQPSETTVHDRHSPANSRVDGTQSPRERTSSATPSGRAPPGRLRGADWDGDNTAARAAAAVAPTVTISTVLSPGGGSALSVPSGTHTSVNALMSASPARQGGVASPPHFHHSPPPVGPTPPRGDTVAMDASPGRHFIRRHFSTPISEVGGGNRHPVVTWVPSHDAVTDRSAPPGNSFRPPAAEQFGATPSPIAMRSASPLRHNPQPDTYGTRGAPSAHRGGIPLLTTARIPPPLLAPATARVQSNTYAPGAVQQLTEGGGLHFQSNLAQRLPPVTARSGSWANAAGAARIFHASPPTRHGSALGAFGVAQSTPPRAGDRVAPPRIPSLTVGVDRSGGTLDRRADAEVTPSQHQGRQLEQGQPAIAGSNQVDVDDLMATGGRTTRQFVRAMSPLV